MTINAELAEPAERHVVSAFSGSRDRGSRRNILRNTPDFGVFLRRRTSNPAAASALCATARLADPTPLFELRRGRAGVLRAKAAAKRRREAGARSPTSRRIQLIEQEPGPRGSPQVPHGPMGPLADGCENDFAGVLDCAANTDSSFCRSTPAQVGQLGDCPWRVKYSK